VRADHPLHTPGLSRVGVRVDRFVIVF